MKKIGIITLFGYHNYGNKLQNYAVQKVLENLGYSVETIKNIKVPAKKNFFKKVWDNKKNIKQIVKNKLSNKINDNLKNDREKKFIEFSKKYINETDYEISKDNIPEDINNNFDFFVTGSDQVWHPSFSASDIEFLSFASPSKRISFSASFGVSNIPKNQQSFYKEKLNEMTSISVRESNGATIVKNLTGKDVDVLVDPTMLLTKEEWNQIIENDYKSENDYIFIYFLGEMTSSYREYINQISKKFNLKIIDVLDMKNKEVYVSDPGEFISLIKNSKLVCTDSFHGSVFSIIMETDFIVFDRIKDNKPTMGSRIDTLLEKFDLKSRKWNTNFDIEKIFSTSFSHTKNILEVENKKALNFIKKSLGTEV